MTLSQLSQDLYGWDLDTDMLVFLGAFRVPSFSQVLETPLLGDGIPTEVKQELRQLWYQVSVVHCPQPAEG